MKQFADESGFLHIYDKNSGLWRKQKPSKTMHRNKYYHQSWVPDGIDPNILESTLGSKVEPNGKNAIAKLLEWKEEITNQDWDDFLIYITFQTLRVPKRAEMAKKLLKSYILINGDPEATKLVIAGKLKLTVTDSFRFNFMAIAASTVFRQFLRMEWEVVTPIDSEFVTTDCPVTFFNPEVYPPLQAGLGLVGTVVLFPLRRDRLLLMRHPEALVEDPKLLDKVPDYDPKEGGTKVFDRLFWPREQVIRHNKLMIEHSDRLAAAYSKGILEEAVGPLEGN